VGAEGAEAILRGKGHDPECVGEIGNIIAYLRGMELGKGEFGL